MNKDIEFKFIKLERTGCEGTCPIYSVKISSSGIVEYNGEMFVNKTGSHQWKINSKAIGLLNNAISKYDYFGMKEKESTGWATCHPYCITSILLKDNTFRKIENYKGSESYPKKLNTLENKIDLIIGIGSA